MGADLDLQDDRILRPREVREGLTTPGTPALLGREFVIFDDGREVGIITPLGTGPAVLLAAGPSRRGLRRGRPRGRRFGRGGGLGLSTEELLLAHAEQRLQAVDLGLELGLTREGAAMHGLPVGGLAPGLELLLQAWANRARTLRDRRSGADGTRRRLGRRRRSAKSVQFRDGDP
jgi:hypothetical protein